MHGAIEESDADFVVLLDAGDRLSPEAIYQVARASWQDPLVDLVTWDDDIVGRDGRRHEPRFRPSWSPELLLGANYLGQSFAMRRARVRAAGNVRNGYGTATRWDLLLRAGLDAERVVRVPRVLGHVRRRHSGVGPDGVRAVQEYLVQHGVAATAELGGSTVRVRWAPELWPHVTVVIPDPAQPADARRVPAEPRHHRVPVVRRGIVDNGGRTGDRERWYRDEVEGLDLTVLWWDEPFNYSAVNNAAAARARVARSSCSSTTTPCCSTRVGCTSWSAGRGSPASGSSARSSSTRRVGSSTAAWCWA